MDLISREYSYKGLRFRAFCDKKGKNGRLVLEDIVAILLDLSNDSRDPKQVTLEQLQQIKIETTEYEGVHLATADSMLDFYLDCDNLSNANKATEFQELAELLANRMAEILETNMVILGRTAFLIPEWKRSAIEISNENWAEAVNEYGQIGLKVWLERTYKLEIYFVLNWVVDKFRNVISPAFRATSGERPVKDGSNLFKPHEFALVEPLITDYLSNTNGEWSNDIKNKVGNEKSPENLRNTEQKIGRRKTQGYATEDIIRELFDVTRYSHIIKKYEKNYLYESLATFVGHVPRSK